MNIWIQFYNGIISSSGNAYSVRDVKLAVSKVMGEKRYTVGNINRK